MFNSDFNAKTHYYYMLQPVLDEIRLIIMIFEGDLDPSLVHPRARHVTVVAPHRFRRLIPATLERGKGEMAMYSEDGEGEIN